jgi:hypothetical protein
MKKTYKANGEQSARNRMIPYKLSRKHINNETMGNSRSSVRRMEKDYRIC